MRKVVESTLVLTQLCCKHCANMLNSTEYETIFVKVPRYFDLWGFINRINTEVESSKIILVFMR